MKYDRELVVSAIDIANEATLLLALATQSDSSYDKIEEASNKFTPPFGNYDHYGLEAVHWDITMQVALNKLIQIAVVVRSLSYHLKNNAAYSASSEKDEASTKKLIDFCSKVIHLTEASFDDKDFIIEIDNAQKPYRYGIYEFCTDVVCFASFAEKYLFENN